jgi:DNA (cytosine-5)-methyltransferase 1
VAYAAGVDVARSVAGGDRRGRPEGPTRNGRGGAIVADADGVASEATGARGVFSDAAARRSLNGANRRGRASGGPWAVEPDVGRVADGVPSRVDRLRGLGNAVVPQVAEYVGRRIVAAA